MIVAFAHDGSVVKSRMAVVPDVVTLKPDNVCPPAVYPAPDTSFVAVYAVVDAPKVAALVYSAIL